MVPLPVLSRTNLADLPSFSSSISFPPNRLRTLELSCGFFRPSRCLFSIICALFDRKPGVAYPFPIFASHSSPVTSHIAPRAQKAQKHPPVSPVFAALTHLLRNPFARPSYANTRDGGAPPPLRKLRALGVSALSFSSIFLRRSPLATHHSPLLSLTLFRINTCISVASKRLYLPLESTLTKKPGEGAIIVNQFSFSQNAFSGIGQPQVCSGSLRTHASVSLWESNPALWLWGVQCCPDSLRSVSLWLCGKSSSSEGRQVGETFAFSAHIVAAQFA